MKSSVAAFAFEEQSLLDVKAEVVQNLKKSDVGESFRPFESHFVEATDEMSHRSTWIIGFNSYGKQFIGHMN